MGDAENALPPSKKRAAGREISRDNPGLDDEEDSSTKRIELLRGPVMKSCGPPESRATTAEVTTEAAIVDEKEVSEDGKNDVNKSEKNEEGNNQQSEKTDEKDPGSAKSEIENVEQSKKGASLSSFQQLSSSQNAFTGLAGTGFSTCSFSFGSTSKDGSTSSVPLFGLKNDKPFGFGLSTNGNSSSLLIASGTSVVSKREGSGFQAMLEVPVETGEENEKVVFSAESVLFEFIYGAWKERDMKLTNMDKRGITFACMNSTGEVKEGLSTFALKFKDASIVEEFRDKGNTAAVLKTPENSPKASED
ncbi:Coatomer, beta' subunit isoform 1 [Hibiscus syriacus]|uniref:Coatomer, beta' subunit isoform 1 n=1 Tax=Hibiscus syriacus TaxID=106335 RepID=A0A6A3BU23_HIBSY|nr:Coatomer, beta' subunit isoform 1 [Hibiscus syriacus]